jgi:hypothetical protein
VISPHLLVYRSSSCFCLPLHRSYCSPSSLSAARLLTIYMHVSNHHLCYQLPRKVSFKEAMNEADEHEQTEGQSRDGWRRVVALLVIFLPRCRKRDVRTGMKARSLRVSTSFSDCICDRATAASISDPFRRIVRRAEGFEAGRAKSKLTSILSLPVQRSFIFPVSVSSGSVSAMAYDIRSDASSSADTLPRCLASVA